MSGQRSISSYFGAKAPTKIEPKKEKEKEGQETTSKVKRGRKKKIVDSDDDFTPSTADTAADKHVEHEDEDMKEDDDDNNDAFQEAPTQKSRRGGRRATRAVPMGLDSEPADAMDVDTATTTAPIKKTASRKRAHKEVKEEEKETELLDNTVNMDTTDTSVTDPPITVKTEQPAKKKFNFWERKARTGPSAPGSKEIPTGAPNCLKGLTFVFTGELTSISREEAADLVKRYSGRVTTAPSSKTSYVVVGEDAGEKKLEKVKAFKIQVLNEDEFLDLIRKSDGKPDEDMTKMGKAVSAVSILNDDTVDNNNNIDGSSSSGGGGGDGVPKIVKTDLWTERYTPKTIRELCGNKSNIERLGEWLRQWNKGRRLEYRAVLISGPPGIGKTTSARLVSINEGFHVIEFNASDARSKKAIEGNLGEIISTKAMIETSSSSELHHRVVIMDEVDGMSAGDRGGIAQLIQLIKKSKIPIICICNDRQSTKVRSLANYCLDLRFRRPEAASIRSRIMSIAFKEGLKLQPNAIDHLVASTHSDIRQILNILSAWKLAHNSLDYDGAKLLGERSEKHIALGPFDIIGKYLQNQAYNSTNLAEKLDLYFHDYSIVPLMMQENYIRMAPSLARSAGGSIKDMDLRTLELVAKASESISQGDLVDHAIHRTQQQWELMPTHALFSCVRPAYFMHGGMQGLYQFPSWLGQYSKAGKADRQLAEVQARMRLRVACGKDEIRASYIPLLSQALTNPLLTAGTDGAQSVIDLLDDYYLAREDWDTIINLCIGRNNGEQLLKQIPSNVKSAFTRLYNKSTHPTVAITKNLAKRDTVSGGGGDQGGQPDLEEAFDVDDEVPAAIDSDEETMADDNLIKKVPTFKSKASGGAKGSKRGRSTKK